MYAVNAIIDGINYDLTDNTATVIAHDYGYTGSILIPDTVSYDGTNYCVRSVGESAFLFCVDLTSITLSESVTSIGENAFYGCSSLTSVTIPESLMSIGENAFFECSNLTTITIPGSLVSIGRSAFGGCSSLTSVVWNAISCPTPNYYANSPFYDIRENITSFTLGDNVTTIPDYLCVEMLNLTSISIPNSVTSIGDGAFNGCSSLTSIIIPESVMHIGSSAFNMCSNLTSIVWNYSSQDFVDYPFVGAYNVTSFTIGDNVVTIPNGLCFEMYNLSSITIPNSVTSIGNGAFKGCSSLTSITIPESVTSIGDWAFEESALTSVTFLGEVPPTIGKDAFAGKDLEEINIPCGTLSAYQGVLGSYNYNIKEPDPDHEVNVNAGSGWITWVQKNGCKNHVEFFVTPASGYSFIGWSDGVTDPYREFDVTQDTTLTAMFALCYSGRCGENLTWEYSDGVLTIQGDGEMDDYAGLAFRDSIYVLNLPNGMTSIIKEAFAGFTHLASVIIPNSVTSIGRYAFADCTNLGSITIGSSVVSIGEGAFAGCTMLYNLICYAVEPPAAHTNSFANYNVFLNVPCNNLMAYQTDVVFGSFKYIQCIGAEETNATTSTVTSTETDATFSWPITTNAEIYLLTITKNGAVCCTLTFNANGQLMNIAFAPSRDGAVHAPAAEQTTTGYKFTVTGLETGVTYNYTIIAKDASNSEVANYSGSFVTKDATGFDSIHGEATITKIISNGHLLIHRDGKTYNAQGMRVE